MSAPTPETPAELAAAREYAAAVRSALADLPPDVVEELAGGLEADLACSAAESATPLRDRLGEPARYAEELRAAAGLAAPAAGAPGGTGGPAGPAPARANPLAVLRADLAQGWAESAAAVRAQRWWPWASDLARTLRPAWWLARAWVVWQLLFGGSDTTSGVLPGSLGGLVALVALSLASVELGRGRWAGRTGTGAGVTAANAVAALALLPVLAAAAAPVSSVQYVTETGTMPSTGVWVDGQVVSNLFPYDAQGNPLTGVQLLDDYGRPVQVGEDNRTDWSGAEPDPYRPAVDAEGQVRWNAYPLQVGAGPDGGGRAVEVPRPEPTLPALVGAPATPSATPSPDLVAPPAAAPTAPPAPEAAPGS